MEEKRLTILIVDDDPAVSGMLKQYLSFRKFSVISVYRGEDAISLLNREKVDFIILDFIMHGMNGMAVAKILKEKYPQVKIIMMTAYPDAGRQVASEVRLDGLFFKPTGMQDLYKKLLAC